MCRLVIWMTVVFFKKDPAIATPASSIASSPTKLSRSPPLAPSAQAHAPHRSRRPRCSRCFQRGVLPRVARDGLPRVGTTCKKASLSEPPPHLCHSSPISRPLAPHMGVPWDRVGGGGSLRAQGKGGSLGYRLAGGVEGWHGRLAEAWPGLKRLEGVWHRALGIDLVFQPPKAPLLRPSPLSSVHPPRSFP